MSNAHSDMYTSIDMREAELHRLSGVRAQPVVKVERSFVFSEQNIKIILAKYIEDTYNVTVDPANVVGDYRHATYGSPLDNDPGYCKFTVKVNG